ncbi:MAG: DUF4388 domain-containing protein [Candidatus Eisenbacteria bacterium]|nr:DUF4388 domain-containing protein [Candidatus Eisenbacteria bacterium]
MALQGNLRDFSAAEILQLLGSQKKTGCLTLESEGRTSVIFVQEGRVVSTRSPGLAKDDPLLAFLRRVHRLSDEQCRGILTIQRESARDLEDLLVNGRYLDAEDLASFVERQVLEDLVRVMRLEQGTYRFDPHVRWTQTALVRLGIEAALMEVARRADEQKRFRETFPDPCEVLGVRDLPDPDVALAEDERELFGVLDGRRTLAEIVAIAPLTEYEACEALQRMLDAGWIERIGSREPGAAPVVVAAPPRTPLRLGRELAFAAAMVALMIALRFGAHALAAGTHHPAGADVFAAAQLRDVRYALDLYRRERGVYPERLEQLVDDRWLPPGRTRFSGYALSYRPERGGLGYRLDLEPDR